MSGNFLKKLSPIFSSKIFIAITFTLVGISLANLTQSLRKPHNEFDDLSKIIEERNHQIFSAFNDDSVFDEMEEMQEQIDQVMKSHRKQMHDLFKKTTKDSQNNSHSSVVSREDENNYYYELKFAGIKKENVAVEVKSGNLTFRAEEEKTDKKNKSHFSSNFYYSFALPKNIAGEPEINRQDDTVIVKLAKKVEKS